MAAVQAGRLGAAVGDRARSVLVYFQFRGDFPRSEQLTMMSSRSGLSMDPGAKVTYNGVEIGRVARSMRSTSAVNPRPRSRSTWIQVPRPDPEERGRRHHATTVFGNKYISSRRRKTRTATHHHIRRDRRDHGDHRVQHIVRDGGVGGGEGGSDQAEPDAGRDGAGAGRARRSVRPVAHPRQRDPGGSESAAATDPLRQPAAGRSGRRVCQRAHRTCGTAWRTR